MTVMEAAVEFRLPDALAAHEPPEARGLARDEVRLMVSRAGDDSITHTRFSKLPEFLAAGDVLVVNTSATINASVRARRTRHDGSTETVLLHLSTPLSLGRWVVELRRTSRNGSSPLWDAEAGERIHLPAGATALLLEPYSLDGSPSFGHVRLWVADLELPSDVLTYASRHGSPIRYGYVREQWPLAFYQTVFANEPGSAEMPSAGRPFSYRVIDRLIRKGVAIAPIVLHTGVSSLEVDEPPYPERYRVPDSTAHMVNAAKQAGGRIVAVGTTAVRALETVASYDGVVSAGAGWTDLVITPERELRTVDAMLTGFHDPKASHLFMLEALAGRNHLALAYATALERRYLWHEFGDVHLILA